MLLIRNHRTVYSLIRAGARCTELCAFEYVMNVFEVRFLSLDEGIKDCLLLRFSTNNRLLTPSIEQIEAYYSSRLIATTRILGVHLMCYSLRYAC